MDTDTAMQKDPLLVQGGRDEQEIEPKVQQSIAPNVQFYDPNAVLDVSKEIALGYLILLTGGNYEYESPSIPNEVLATGDKAEDVIKQKEAPQSARTLPVTDEQTVALAYAAITDGNVLHTCFGLKSGPNGRPTNVIGEKQSSSIFCCFPSASAASFQNLRSNKGKKEMQQLVELLRDVKDLEYGAKGKTVDMVVIQSYVQCFATVVRYHDELSTMKNSGVGSANKSMFCPCPNFLISWRNKLFSSKTSELDIKIEELQKSTLADIMMAFDDLRVCIAQVQTDAVSVAETGVTVDCREDM